MTTVGIKELKTRIGRYLRLVVEGETLIVTDRRRPVAELKPIDSGESRPEALRELAGSGVVTLGSGGTLAHFEPLVVSGPPLSQTLLEGRDERIQ